MNNFLFLRIVFLLLQYFVRRDMCVCSSVCAHYLKNSIIASSCIQSAFFLQSFHAITISSIAETNKKYLNPNNNFDPIYLMTFCHIFIQSDFDRTWRRNTPKIWNYFPISCNSFAIMEIETNDFSHISEQCRCQNERVFTPRNCRLRVWTRFRLIFFIVYVRWKSIGSGPIKCELRNMCADYSDIGSRQQQYEWFHIDIFMLCIYWKLWSPEMWSYENVFLFVAISWGLVRSASLCHTATEI